jgi:hypothetical protein
MGALLLGLVIGVIATAVVMTIYKKPIEAAEAEVKAKVEAEVQELKDLETKVGDKAKAFLATASADLQPVIERYLYLKNKLK